MLLAHFLYYQLSLPAPNFSLPQVPIPHNHGSPFGSLNTSSPYAQKYYWRTARMKAKIIHVLCEGQTEQGFVEGWMVTTQWYGLCRPRLNSRNKLRELTVRTAGSLGI